MRRFFICLFAIFWALSLFSQGIISDFSTKDFPSVSFTLHSFSPDTLTAAGVRVLEEGKEVPVTKLDISQDTVLTSKRNVLLLWDKSRIGIFTAELLNDFIKGMFNSRKMADLKVNIGVFNRDQQGEKVYNLLSSKFTNDLETVRKLVMTEAGKESSVIGSMSDLVWALTQAVTQMKSLPADEARAVVLFTNGNNNVNSGLDISSLVNAAKKNRVPIYVVNIQGDEAGRSLCEQIATSTKGLYLYSPGSTETADKRALEREKGVEHAFSFVENEIISKWFDLLAQRWNGVSYRITFTSQFDRIDETKQILLESGNDSYASSYHIPGFSLWHWIKSHPILSPILLFVLLAALSAGIIFFIRHRRVVRDMKRMEQEQLDSERERIKSEQAALRRKLETSESEQHRKRALEESREKAAQRNERLSAMNALMSSKNVKARLLVFNLSGSTEHIVTTSEVSLGSSPDNDIVIDDRTVSRHHAILYYNGTSFAIRDQHSTNGIVMNGIKVDDLELRNGDTVSLGKTTIKIYF